jgi:DNA-binding response OmpR family regulator
VSADKASSRLLFIDGDELLLRTLRQHFEIDGYQVDTAATGQEGLALAETNRPNLILLAARMPDLAGLDVFRLLRDRPRTGHIPVMILAGPAEMVLQKRILEEGAYDFIEKPLDLDILSLRVRNALRRAEREGLTESRTGLPTGRLIDDRLKALENERGWYKITLQVENVGVFRDLYGFVTANEALRFTGNLISQVVSGHGTPDDFVGHRNGTEEFVIITTQTHGPALVEKLSERVTPELQSFYNFMEREQGYVLVEDGAGGQAQKPLMAAQIGVAQGAPDPDAPAATTPTASTDDVWVDAVDLDDDASGDSPSGGAFEW